MAIVRPIAERLQAAAREIREGKRGRAEDAKLMEDAAATIERLALAHYDLQAALAIADARRWLRDPSPTWDVPEEAGA